MKNILVATDFSNSADNASLYAAQLARAFDAKLILFHCFSIPVVFGETPVIPISFEEMEKAASGRLQSKVNMVMEKTGVQAEFLVAAGDATEEVLSIAKKKHIDLVIVGMKETGAVASFLIGSTATAIIKKNKFPVMVIPEKAAYQPIDKIVFASDYASTPVGHPLHELKMIAEKFNSKVSIVNMIKHGEAVDIGKSIEGMKLEMNFAGIDHSVHFPECDSVAEGLVSFVDEYGGDLIVMMHHKHDLFYRIFHASETERVAFHSLIPLLNLPDA